MYGLHILLVILIGVGNFASIQSQMSTSTTKTTIISTSTTKKPCTVSKCYRNQNGICRTFDIPCSAKNPDVKHSNVTWRVTNTNDCKNRARNEAKVCNTDCRTYKTALCVGRNPVCAYRPTTKTCRKFDNICHLKKDACSVNNIKDYRVANLRRCQGLAINGPAASC